MESIFTPATRPGFCPNPSCTFHRNSLNWRYKKAGFFPRKNPPHRVQRYRCLACGVSFSGHSYSLDYWSHRFGLFPAVFSGLVACSGIRQIARSLAVSPSAVLRRARRLGRHCLLLNELFRRELSVAEPIVLDGFESFAWSQYFPLHLNLVVGSRSLLVYGFSLSELRRKGRMTARQKRRRAELERRYGRPDPRAIEVGVEEVLRLVVPENRKIVLHTDDLPAYPRVLRRLRQHCIRHIVTPSVARRTTRNPLFPVNLTDLLLRHSSANHKRETIAFSKTMAGVIERAAVLVAWRNLMKSRSEKRRDDPPAVSCGIIPRALEARELLARRLFLSRMTLPPLIRRFYDREVPTRPLTN